MRRHHYVSSVVHDHTSILKFIETKWNLGALTYRDANADNLFDSLKFKGRPHFIDPPTCPHPHSRTRPTRACPATPEARSRRPKLYSRCVTRRLYASAPSSPETKLDERGGDSRLTRARRAQAESRTSVTETEEIM